MSEQRKDFALYQCAVCKKKFVAADYVSVRKATGKTVECCGTPAYWLEGRDKWVCSSVDALSDESVSEDETNEVANCTGNTNILQKKHGIN